MSNHKNIPSKNNQYNNSTGAPRWVGDANGTPLTKFASRIASAMTTKSTSFTMTVTEANAIFAAINEIVAQNSELNSKIYELQNQVLKEKSVITKVVADGGGFK